MAGSSRVCWTRDLERGTSGVVTGKEEEIVDEMRHHKLDILGISETKRKGTSQITAWK